MRRFPPPRSTLALIVLAALTACAGEADTRDAAAPPAPTQTESTAEETDRGPAPAASEGASADDGEGTEADPEGGEGAAPGVGDACALLDATFLDAAMEGSTTMLGTPFEFADPLQESPSEFCSWNETNTSLSLQVTLEPAATSAIDDHSGRAYNLEVEPTPVAQDGPGTDAVLLVDKAFDEVEGEGFAYGYFFVAGDVTVFVESVGLDLGEDGLRAVADEAASRLGAG